MKIFVTKDCPTGSFYCRVLAFLLDHACRSEIDHYLDMIERNKETKKVLTFLSKCDIIESQRIEEVDNNDEIL